ncbi:hypothetical protein U1Q18_044048, partial [Sarracenia purpurea var. burkii]
SGFCVLEVDYVKPWVEDEVVVMRQGRVVWGRAIRKSALWILTKLGWTLEKMKLFHACVHALRALDSRLSSWQFISGFPFDRWDIRIALKDDTRAGFLPPKSRFLLDGGTRPCAGMQIWKSLLFIGGTRPMCWDLECDPAGYLVVGPCAY